MGNFPYANGQLSGDAKVVRKAKGAPACTYADTVQSFRKIFSKECVSTIPFVGK